MNAFKQARLNTGHTQTEAARLVYCTMRAIQRTEATDEQLSLPEDQLKEVLRKRLPALITAFLEDTSVVYPECTSF